MQGLLLEDMMVKGPSKEGGPGSATFLGLCRHETSPCVRRIDIKWNPRRSATCCLRAQRQPACSPLPAPADTEQPLFPLTAPESKSPLHVVGAAHSCHGAVCHIEVI